MKQYTIKFQTWNSNNEVVVVTDKFPLKNKEYVLKEDILKDIHTAHPEFKEVVLLDCDIRIWNISNGDDCIGQEYNFSKRYII